MKQASKRRARRWVWFVAAIAATVVVSGFWVLSFWTASGIGLGTDPGAAVRHNVEVSLGRGGLVIVVNGSRTDVSFYDENMGCGWGPDLPGIYGMYMERVAAPVIWWPSVQRPAGTYVLLPFWMLAGLPLGLFAALCWRRARVGTCAMCGYSLKGLGAGAVCPECGEERAGQARA